MRAHIIENGVVTNTIVVESLTSLPGLTLIDADTLGGSIGWTWDGTKLSAPVVPFDAAAYSQQCEDAIQSMMDATAKSHGYDSLERCITYKDSTVLLWQHEGQNALAWRDACWQKAQQIKNDATAGNWPTTGANQIPTPEQVVAAMPASNWPTA